MGFKKRKKANLQKMKNLNNPPPLRYFFYLDDKQKSRLEKTDVFLLYFQKSHVFK